MQSAVDAHGPQKGAKRVVHVRPESGTKTDVVSRGALVKKVQHFFQIVFTNVAQLYL